MSHELRTPLNAIIGFAQLLESEPLGPDRREGVGHIHLHLPDISGEDVLRRLREDPQTRGIPVAILSAAATPSQVRHFLAARAYLTKPLDVKQTLGVFDSTLTRKETGANGG